MLVKAPVRAAKKFVVPGSLMKALAGEGESLKLRSAGASRTSEKKPEKPILGHGAQTNRRRQDSRIRSLKGSRPLLIANEVS
jgi:hypothetical protein